MLFRSDRNTSIGYGSSKNITTGDDNVSIGFNAGPSGGTTATTVAIGNGAVTGNMCVSVGHNATCSSTRSVTMGYGASAFFRSVSIGYSASAFANYSTALGSEASASYDNSTSIGYGTTTSVANQMHFGNTSVSSIQGQVGFTTYSDSRVKKNVQEDVSGLAFIKELRPVTYNYDIRKENEIMGVKESEEWEGKYDVEKIRFSGFLAQEVDAAAKKTGYNFSGVDKSSNLWGLRYSEFVVPIVKSVQEQQTIIENQQKLIDELMRRIEALEKK
mgnify:CR=1 FL=1